MPQAPATHHRYTHVDYADEAFAVLSQDFLKAGKTPEGFDLQQLQADLAEIGSVPATRAAIFHKRP